MSYSALTLAGFWAARAGYADYLFHTDTLEFVRQASVLCPRNARYQARLADLDPANSEKYLKRAVELDPGVSDAWIRLGLRSELAGRLDQAESYYLQAARWDRQFLPAWTLAGYYGRRSDAANFWPRARHAAAMSHLEIRPLLRLAFTFTDDPKVVLEKMIGPGRKSEHEFLAYLIAERMDASALVARMMTRAEPEDLRPLLKWTDRLLEEDKPAEARTLWDVLGRKGLVPAACAGLLTNADFAREPLQAGFDWRTTPPFGVTFLRADSGLRIQFSGKQPEAFDLANQYVDLLPGRSYTLSMEYRTVDIEQSTNLRWKLGTEASPQLLAAEEWTPWSWNFTSGAAHRLALAAQREPGGIRPEGIVYMRGLRLAANPSTYSATGPSD